MPSYYRPFVRSRNYQAAATTAGPLSLTMSHGRLYARGAPSSELMAVRGAARHDKGWVELSLTLERMRDAREALGYTPHQFAAACSPDVLRWAKAVGTVEKAITALHEKIASGWRAPLHWIGGTEMPPYDHQRIMASVATTMDGSAFFADTGTGKTRAALASIQHHFRENRLDAVLIVAPKRSFATWRTECAQWAPDCRLIVLEGSIAARAMALRGWRGERAIFLTNYEALAKLAPVFVGTPRMGFVLDEAHRVRNPQTQTGKAAMECARSAAWRLIMTASPVLQGIQDAWSQMYCVDVGLTFGANFVQYRREWCDADEWGKLTPKPGAVDAVGQRMRKRGLFFAKKDCLDLPPVIGGIERPIMVEVDMTTDQRKAYRDMAAHLVATLDADTRATTANQLTAMMMLSQITSGHLRVEDGTRYRFTPNAKLDVCEETVRENIGAQQIVVWACWREDIEMLMERFADLRPVRIDGSVTEAESSAAVDAITNGNARLLIANQQAGGASLNLQAASLAIYYSQRFNLEHRIQSEGRTLRAGSNRHANVTYLDLVMPNTIDTIVLDALAAKQDVAGAVANLRAHIAREGN